MRTLLLWVLLSALLQLSSGSGACVSKIQAFVEREPDVGLVYSVTVRSNGSELRPSSLSSSFASSVCCEFTPWVEALGGNRSQRVECSAGHGHSRDPSVSSRGGACLLVESTYGASRTLQLDATLALSAYLGWVSGAAEEASHGDEILLRTRGECTGESGDGGRLCSLHVSSDGTGVVRALTVMDFDRILLAPREFKLALRKGANSASLASGSGRLDGASNVFFVTLSNPEIDQEQSIQTLSARLGGLVGRRLLRAKLGSTARTSYQRCDRGRLPCMNWVGWSVGVVITLAGVSVFLILCAGSKDDETPADFLDTVPSLPPRFSYSKLQKATKNFSRKLGDGAFGSVYEGTLANGARVAVKMLEKTSVQGEKQFRAEVASMGAIRHLNLVRLHGFCSEGSHRLLVYEFMPNGSLDAWLFGKKQGEKLLDWEQRLNIALGTARALAYLHEECSDHIIHLDVKPENILLDHQFCPKLSDFGLAKLMDREQSRVVTSMRGTPGYLAPEWLLPHAAVTAKTDVYSFGMVLLELISGRENTNFSLGKEQWYFPAWAFKLMGEGRTMELLDKRLHVEEVEYFHKKDAMRAIHCALLCIQDDPSLRPPMSRVVHMLQGHVEPEPLNARQSAIQPPRRLLTAFAASRSDVDPHHPQGMEANTQNNHDNHHQAVGPAVSTRIPVAESPRVRESPRVMNLAPSPRTLQDLDETAQFVDRMEPLPPAVQTPNQARGNNAARMAGAHSLSNNAKSIPPWPVKGDIILTRGQQGDQHCVVRDVRVQGKQMRLANLHRLSSETRWSVREEEQSWRNWNESVKTLDFWVVVRWSTIPGRGFEKFPVEWMTR